MVVGTVVVVVVGTVLVLVVVVGTVVVLVVVVGTVVVLVVVVGTVVVLVVVVGTVVVLVVVVGTVVVVVVISTVGLGIKSSFWQTILAIAMVLSPPFHPKLLFIFGSVVNSWCSW